MVKWKKEIPGISPPIEAVFSQSNSPDLHVWIETEDGFPPIVYWSSPHLDMLDDPAVVSDRAAGLKALMDGVLYIILGSNYLPISIGSISNSKGITVHLGNPNTEPFAPKIVNSQSNNAELLQSDFDKILFLARQDASVRHHLQMLGIHGPTMQNMYVLCEDMQKIAGWNFATIDQKGGASKPTTKRLRATVNNPTNGGVHSRHGGAGTPSMNDIPISLEEASPVILRAYEAFLIERI